MVIEQISLYMYESGDHLIEGPTNSESLVLDTAKIAALPIVVSLVVNESTRLPLYRKRYLREAGQPKTTLDDARTLLLVS